MNDLPVSTGFVHTAESASILLTPPYCSPIFNRRQILVRTFSSPLASLQERNVSMSEGPPNRLKECGNQHATARRAFLFSAIVCVGMCMCVSGLLRSTAGIHTGRHSQIGFYQNPDGQRNHKDPCQQIPAAGTGREMLFLSRYSTPFIPDNGFLFVKSGISEPEPCL